MKTNDLISVLAQDTNQITKPKRFYYVGLIATVAAVFYLFIGSMGVRPDFFSAIGSPFVLAKHLLPLALVLLVLPLGLSMYNPQNQGQNYIKRLSLLGVLLLVILGLGFISLPREGWAMAFWGKSYTKCIISIPLLAFPILIATLVMLRNGAVANSVRAGFIAGLSAGGIATLIYAFQCTEDSPLFYGFWYSLAILGSAFAGAILGKFYLRW